MFHMIKTGLKNGIVERDSKSWLQEGAAVWLVEMPSLVDNLGAV